MPLGAPSPLGGTLPWGVTHPCGTPPGSNPPCGGPPSWDAQPNTTLRPCRGPAGPAGTPGACWSLGTAGALLGTPPWGLWPAPWGPAFGRPPWPAGVCFYIAFARFVLFFFVFSFFFSGELWAVVFFVYLLFFCFFGGGGARVVVSSDWFWVDRCRGRAVCFGLVRLVDRNEDAGLLRICIYICI